MVRDRPITGYRPGGARGEPAAPVEEPESSSWLTPGRTIRIPAGYLFIGAALLLACFAAGWAVGFIIAERNFEAERAAMFDRSMPIRDPVLSGDAGGSASGVGDHREEGDPARSSGSGQSAGDDGWLPVVPESDPRQPGLNYYIVARLFPEEARRAAEFLRSEGLEAVVVSSDTARFRHVVVLPGFEGTISSPEARRVQSEVRRLGRIWKRDHRGTDAFESAYFSKYR